MDELQFEDQQENFGKLSPNYQHFNFYQAKKFVRQWIKAYRRRIEGYMLYTKQRWSFTSVVYLLYLLRIYWFGGYYVVSYLLGLYVLQGLVQFLTPLGLPTLDEEEEAEMRDEPILISDLPTTINTQDTDSRPLIRSLNEFHFWQSLTIAGILSLGCTFAQMFNFPVFWPLLFLYFFLLVCVTLKKQLRHMVKYGYKPWDFGRKNKTLNGRMPSKNDD